MTATPLPLPLPTNATKEGPRFRGDSQRVLVLYDCERDDGTSEWNTIAFDEVLQFEFRPAVACTAYDVVGANEVRVQTTSERLAATMARWKDAVGWQEWQQSRGGATRYKHFTVFFDDAGCVDVIAAACESPRAPTESPDRE